MTSSTSHHRRAFTLVELLLSVGIIAMLLILGLTVGGRILRGNAMAIRCTSNLHQLGIGFHLFAGENNGRLPALTGDSAAPTKDEQNGKGHQWDMQLTPYLSVKAASGKQAQKETVFFCPCSEPDPSYSGNAVVPLSYTYNAVLGKSETSPGVRLSESGSFSLVMMLADLQLAASTEGHSYVPQTGQGKNNVIIFRGDYAALAYRHQEKTNILFVDGSVAPRQRLVDGVPSSPPENIRLSATGAITGLR